MAAENDILSDLNPGQLGAVKSGPGPLLIIAGAGTGKTTVITRRISYLIAAKKAKPGEILALTFTDKAAGEMETRVDQLVPYGYVDVSIFTFHAFGDRVLRDWGLEIGIRPDYRVLSQAEQAVFFLEHIFQFPLKHYLSLSDPARHVDALLKVISRAKDEDVEPEEFLAFAKKQKDEKMLEVAKVYQKYQRLKNQKGFVDFSDQVNLTLKLFREHPRILKLFQERYKYVLVDEFQDTNYAQFELLKLLVKKHRNITVVGDDDQSIYKFRGAAVSNILNFQKVYKNCKKVVLTKNYRSSQLILDAAYKLIQHNNPDRLGLSAMPRQDATIVEHNNFDAIYSEADWVAKKIKEKYESGLYKLSDFAILTRSNANADPFCRSLNMAGLANQFSGGLGLYTFPEVRLAISFLRVLGDLADSVSLYDLAGSEFYRLDSLDLQKLNTFAGRRNYTLHHVFAHLEDGSPEFEVLNDLKPKTKEIIQSVMADIREYLDYAKEHSTGEVLYLFFKRTGYLKRLNESGTAESENKIKNLAQFFDKIREFSEVAEVDRVAEFVKYFCILKESGDDPESSQPDLDQDAVNVLTVHKAKGLEFPVVFIVCLADEKFPVRRRRDPIELPAELVSDILPSGDFHLQEERRLFYVAMTRAKTELYLTSSQNFGGKRASKISQFVLEALDKPRADIQTIKRSPAEQIELFAPQKRAAKSKNKKEEILSLSYYHINDYLTCPLKYKYVHILRIPLLPNHQIIFGSALHKAAQAYHIAKKSKHKFSAKDIEKVFLNHWSSEGFISREHEELRLAQGKQALAKFYKREEKSGQIPFLVEEWFTINREKIRIKGRFDRVDHRNGEVVVIDYKSSDVREQKEADNKARESLQLSIYALAWQQMFSKIPDQLELHFLGSGLIGSAHRSQKDLDKTWGKIEQAASGIAEEEYRAKPSAFTCSWCAYSEVCPESAA